MARAGIGKLTEGYSLLNAKLAAFMAVAASGAGLFNITKDAMMAGNNLYKLQTRLNMTTGEDDYRGNFDGAGSGVNFWSATEINNAFAYRWRLNAIDASLLKEYMVFGKSYGFAVRCFQDSP